jgi:hypothetical protein
MNRADAGQLVEQFQALGLPASFVFGGPPHRPVPRDPRKRGYQVLVNTEADQPAVVVYTPAEGEKLLAKIKAIKARTQEAARGS